MTAPVEQNQASQEQPNNKELNFRALEAKYQRELAQERAAREQAERVAQEALAKRNHQEDEEVDNEPYVDNRKLEKKLARFGEQSQKQTQSDIQKAVQQAIQEERKQGWMKQNGDFYEIMGHAEKLAQRDPELAEAILGMPDSFERQKLVYKNIKALGLHMPEQPKNSVQDKINANRQHPGYQPSGPGSPPHQAQGDFSMAGREAAYRKIMDLKKRIG